MMQKTVIGVSALMILSACSGGINISDFRPRPDPTPVAVAPPTPQPPLLTAKERLVLAIENNGCAMTADNVGAVLDQATISRSEMVPLTQQLVAEGRAEAAGSGTIRVISGRCA